MSQQAAFASRTFPGPFPEEQRFSAPDTVRQRGSQSPHLRGVEKGTFGLSDNKKTILGRSGNEISNPWLLAQLLKANLVRKKIEET